MGDCREGWWLWNRDPQHPCPWTQDQALQLHTGVLWPITKDHELGLQVQETAASQPRQIQIKPPWEAQNAFDGREEFLKQYFQRGSVNAGDSKLSPRLHPEIGQQRSTDIWDSKHQLYESRVTRRMNQSELTKLTCNKRYASRTLTLLSCQQSTRQPLKM